MEAAAVALLLELSASDDLTAFMKAVEENNLPLDASAPWYSRTIGPASSLNRAMRYDHRTPAMIAALYGSTAVLGYILGQKAVDVNRHCGTDGATALHCAAAGGSPASVEAVRLLIEASADADAVDSKGNRPGDVIAKQFSASTARDLEVLLKSPCPRVSSPSKKEYPLDSTLPDIKSGIYGTDEFRMFTFKVKPCSRAYSHDWTECPFVHPGENARRRDPRKFTYSCVPCPDFRKGSCSKGDECEYAHGVFESWLHPAQYRTRLCKDEVGCNRRVCFFAHKPEELRSVNPTAASVAGVVSSSPRSSSVGLSSFDIAAALMLLQSAPGSPMSPSASSAMSSPAAWMNPAGSATSSRLKSSLSARNLDFNLESSYQHKPFDEMPNIASPRSNWKTNSLNLSGSLDELVRSQLQSQQLQSFSGGNLPSSPVVNSSSTFGLDNSMAKAILNSRQAAFAKRSQSFIDRRGAIASPVISPEANIPPLGLSDWGSPDGKLDWGIQGDELNKLKKSATFNYRSNPSGKLGSSNSQAMMSVLKDSPTAAMCGPGLPPISRPMADNHQKQYLDFLSWEQLYADQEQLVASS
ncbi:Zinc finger CCCH domain-containing protein 66 [Apostasia shenzhenica]|uniref:Zinc finger CCCH domain-containing protein 66 n=1 Tax=Apostasia shenzhenica TaxID=1088818 RepID=A0A2I0BGI0_9ASPA|nr:Zinc finger CCCH domain-containing protein 66 [Apostasia shenzhenica]